MLRFFLARLLRRYRKDYERDFEDGLIVTAQPNLAHFLAWLDDDKENYYK